MTPSRLVLNSFRHYWRSHLGAFLGAAIGTAVLTGALIVGDSVRGSLKEMALSRLGKVDLALDSADRLIRHALAGEIQNVLENAAPPMHLAGVLHLPSVATRADASARANQVELYGVPEAFWNLAPEPPPFTSIPPGEVVLNETLTGQLNVNPGDAVLFRIQKPALLSRDAPLAPDEDVSVALRLRVHAVVTDAQFGRFSLKASQLPPHNAFVALDELQRAMDAHDRANLILAGNAAPAAADPDLGLAAATTALRSTWTLEDAQLELRALSSGGLELRTGRVFLDQAVSEAALAVHPEAAGILTYLVNSLSSHTNATPYSMVTAAAPSILPAPLDPEGVLISEWLADDLKVRAGDPLNLRYYVVGISRKLEEKSAAFTIRGTYPMNSPVADPALMPDFPGLSDAENCREWDTGFAMDLDAIRDKDEEYWDKHRGTPKALIALEAGLGLWTNRFGALTMVRYPSGVEADDIANRLRDELDPALFGFVFEPVRALALAASSQGQPFGGLFIGFSFFLIAAALILVALLFGFGVERRSAEIGTLLALGFTRRRVRRLLLGEGAGLALLGSVTGLAGGILYARAMIHALGTIWREAVGTSAIAYHAHPATLAAGAVAGFAAAVLAIALALRRQASQPAQVLLAGGGEEHLAGASLLPARRRGFILPSLCLLLGLALVGWSIATGRQDAPGIFFGAGALVLISALLFCSAMLGAWQHPPGAEGSAARGSAIRLRLTLRGIGLRNAARRRKRSLATLGLLACGSFLIASISVFRLEANRDAGSRSSGTGGFEIIGEATVPIVHDLNTPEGLDAFALDSALIENVRFVPFRLLDGEDASCLNLNRAQQPRLLGVQPGRLKELGAFTFASAIEGAPERDWNLLDMTFEDGAIPAIGDAASIQWALGMRIGGTLTYLDSQGAAFKIRLVAGIANSILQGSLIISERAFVQKFPNQSGYRFFLIDAPRDRTGEIAAELSTALADAGMELTLADRRLAQFNAVQNTYLSTFQVLGGLGLILGSIGLAVVLLRNVLERRGELALLLAVGFRPGRIRQLVLIEHSGLLVCGLAAGVFAAALAVLPALLATTEIPFKTVGFTLAAVLLNGLLWTWIAARLALRGDLLDSLRNQ